MAHNDLLPIHESQLPLFFQKWWLDIVCRQGKYSRSYSNYKDRLFAISAWYIKSKYGISYASNPPYTPYSGIYWFPNSQQSSFNQQNAEERVVQSLLEKVKLPNLVSFRLHPALTNWYPFYILGFKQTTRYTYRIHPENRSVLLGKMKPTLRNTLKNKFDPDTVDRHPSLDEILDLLSFHFRSKNLDKFFHRAIISDLISEGQKQDCFHPFAIRKENGSLSSLVITFSDDKAHYCLFTASTPSAGNEEVSLLLWEAIQTAVDQQKIFDFEGSMLKGVEQFYRSFGGVWTSCHQIFRRKGWPGLLFNLLKR